MLVLNQSGVGDVSQLEYYVRTEIIRYGSKLHDLRRRLEVAYQHLLQVILICKRYSLYRGRLGYLNVYF